MDTVWMAEHARVTDIVEDARTNTGTLSALESDIDAEDVPVTSMSTAIDSHKDEAWTSQPQPQQQQQQQILRERRGHRHRPHSSLTASPTKSRVHLPRNDIADMSHVNGTPYRRTPPAKPSMDAAATASRKPSTKTRTMPSTILMDIMLAEKRHASTSHVASDTLLYGQSDAHISRQDAQRELAELEADLCPEQCAYPNNITLPNYLTYLIVPTLVYEISYPRTPRIRPAYVFEKLAAILGTFTLMYMTVEHYVLPALYQTAHLPIWYALPQMLFPVLVVFLLSFFIIFEFICNAFAELARFADRSFYDDWWNSTTFEEFARNWNKPVHHFLLRHVYVPLYRDCGLSRYHASLLTFLISSIFHELAIAVVCGNLRMYLFLFQMAQIPLIWISKLVGPKTREVAGNWFFWFSMTVGPPLLLCLYCREIIQPNGSLATMVLGGEPMI
ncbi:MBOAT, membrane-bound O-acyltransferase family-domain-containing protein [Syncephalis pseudoplumigaleata]|uniref:MBOAT, membrane-bound O-acyltransferase family-domain-containing protein n=1 Tax=Syncephalis pseudoplumigaleata TaxID=1712513 RepID=A0A4P9YWV2_9FUNG|nr:MBOAT, membrane-bound O-acyltransferase family-domain-containing protein [Syncephalis pseudoplumigaleata]|eukprot:RKP23982.1 MBOAT, membrane-bound O-acyltransferase family-domain-containing protein [Syncephalis pseudoplumigaleata]